MPEPPAQKRNKTHARNTQRWILVIALVALSIGFALAPAGNSRQATSRNPEFSKFSHNLTSHSRLSCQMCHRREGNETQVRRPGHASCAGCHYQQFNDASSAICTICHTDTQSAKPQSKPLPALKSFTVTFEHAKHTSARCATCHKPARNGVALSIPSGGGAHPICFQCHATRTAADGRNLSSCDTCHQKGKYERPSEWTRAYKVSFSHAAHNTARLSCAECHSVKAGTHNEVTSPMVNEHSASRSLSCRNCHNNKRAFGEDFASCKRCHQGQTFRF
jgi:Cytochrome c7 and related cytochrome c